MGPNFSQYFLMLLNHELNIVRLKKKRAKIFRWIDFMYIKINMACTD